MHVATHTCIWCAVLVCLVCRPKSLPGVPINAHLRCWYLQQWDNVTEAAQVMIGDML
jgi:hypothetical protein